MSPTLILVLLTVLGNLALAEEYTIQTKTSRCLSCRTNKIYVYVTLIGMDGREVTTSTHLDNRYDNFRIGRTDTFTITNLDAIGELKCIVLKANGRDAWRFDWIQVKSASYPEWVKFVNSEKSWMSADTGEGMDVMRMCGEECDEELPISTDNWELEDVVYDVDAEEIMSFAPQNVGEQHIDNEGSSTAQSTSFLVEESVTETASYTHTAGVSVMVGTSFSCGIPSIVDGEVTTEVTASYEFEYGTEYSTTKSVSANYNCVAPAGRTVTCKALLFTGKMAVPYTQYWKHKRLECVRESAGVFEQVSATKLILEIEEDNVFADGF